MRIDDFGTETIVTAERGMYLKYADETLTDNRVGKPIRIIFSKKAIIPDFEEKPLFDEPVVTEKKEEVEEKKSTKTTKKKSTK